MTVTERRLWLKLRGRQMDGWKFRRQAPIGDYIVDFYCAAARLVIELNGESHGHEVQFDYDQRRKAWLESRRYKVLTFSALYPEMDYLEGVWDTIDLELSRIPTRAPLPRVDGIDLMRASPQSGEEIYWPNARLPAKRGGDLLA
jgi:very-short-patch-repair endonuclease